MKGLRNVFSDAGLHVLMLAALALGVGAWMVREKPARLDTDDVEIACRYCGDLYSVKSIYPHVRTAHRAEAKAEAAALANNTNRRSDESAHVRVIH